MHDLRKMNKVVGIKQTKKAIMENVAKRVIVAEDADPQVIVPIVELCKEMGVAVERFDSMQELGALCEIEVSAAVVCEII